VLLTARPLYDNDADAQFFVRPRVWDSAIRAMDSGLNVAVLGARGAGKTTLLRQLQRQLREQDRRAAFVDATAVADGLELAIRIRDAVRGGSDTMIDQLRLMGMGVAPGETPVAGAASRALVTVLSQLESVEPTTVLVDASGSAEALYTLFGRMRDVLWQQDHRWVVAIDADDRATALKPPADAFFDSVLTLGEWPLVDLLALLTRRWEGVKAPVPESFDKAAAAAHGNPREALRILSEDTVRDRDSTDPLEARGRLLNEASGLGRPHGMLMAELLDRGQASASDQALQRTLGVTRARLSQLLNELAAFGLVTAENERSEGPGRPRVIYRPDLS
jgi:energy-coupling factor transporter ATP-binding protein EcfA2